MGRTLLVALVWVGIGTIGTGCLSRSPSNVVITQTAGTPTSAIVVHDDTLAKDVRFVEHRAVPRGDLIEAYALVQNQTEYTVAIEYKVEWYDANDISIESPITSWKPTQIYGRETKALREVAPRPDATGFKLFIRSPNAVER